MVTARHRACGSEVTVRRVCVRQPDRYETVIWCPRCGQVAPDSLTVAGPLAVALEPAR